MAAGAANTDDRGTRRHAQAAVFVAVLRGAACAAFDFPCDTRAMQRDVIAVAAATGYAAEKPVADRPVACGRSGSRVGTPALCASIGFDPVGPIAGTRAPARTATLNRDVVAKITSAVEARYDIAGMTGAGPVLFRDGEGLGLGYARKENRDKKGNEPTHGSILVRIHRQAW